MRVERFLKHQWRLDKILSLGNQWLTIAKTSIFSNFICKHIWMWFLYLFSFKYVITCLLFVVKLLHSFIKTWNYCDFWSSETIHIKCNWCSKNLNIYLLGLLCNLRIWIFWAFVLTNLEFNGHYWSIHTSRKSIIMMEFTFTKTSMSIQVFRLVSLNKQASNYSNFKLHLASIYECDFLYLFFKDVITYLLLVVKFLYILGKSLKLLWIYE